MIKQEKRTAIISLKIDEKDIKKSEKQVKLVTDKCKEFSVSINGEKSNLNHDLTSKGMFTKGSKEVANLHWSALVQGSNTGIGNLSEALFKELKNEAPKIEFKYIEPTHEEITKAEDEGIALGCKLALARAKIMAAGFGVELDGVLKLTYTTSQRRTLSYQDAFDDLEDSADSSPMLKSRNAFRKRSVSHAVDPKTVTMAVVKVEVKYKIKP